jgi:hypothetical protein
VAGSVTLDECGGLYERSRAGVGVRAQAWACVGAGAHTGVCMRVYMCVHLFCVSRIQIVLSESVNNQTNFHELTTHPTKTKQTLTESQQQRTTKQIHTDSTGVMRRLHESTV